MHTVKRDSNRQTLIDCHNWLKDEAEAHERIKASSGKSNFEENPTGNVTKSKTKSKVFAAKTTSTKNTLTTRPSTKNSQVSCVFCKDEDPLWQCQVFRKKTATNERKLLPRTNFACHALMENIRSATAQRPGNAPKMVVEVRTTFSYMVQKKFYRKNLNLERTATVKQLLVA